MNTGSIKLVVSAPEETDVQLNTGTIKLVDQDPEELFNHSHDRRGRFGTGGSSSAGSSSKESGAVADAVAGKSGPMKGERPSPEQVASYRKDKLKKLAIGVGVAVVVTGLLIAGVKYDQGHIDGQKIQKGPQEKDFGGFKTGYYAVKSKHGTDVVLVDQAGLKPGQRKTLLKLAKEVHEKVPSPDGKGVVVNAKSTHELSPDAEAFTAPTVPNTIMVNTSRFFHPELRNGDLRAMGPEGKVFFTQDYYHGVKAQQRHLIFHEYGHLTDDGALNHEALQVKVNKAFKVSKSGKGLGKYATKDKHEAYAEAFADWHTTGGKTTSVATHDYAKEFGWK